MNETQQMNTFNYSSTLYYTKTNQKRSFLFSIVEYKSRFMSGGWVVKTGHKSLDRSFGVSQYLDACIRARGRLLINP